MIRWLRARLGDDPEACFTESELRAQGETAFRRLVQARVLRRADRANVGDICALPGVARLLTVAEAHDGSLEAIDDTDPDFDPVPLGLRDLLRWRVDIEEVARLVHRANRLRGVVERLSARFVICGEALFEGEQIGVVLACLPSTPEAAQHLRTLPSLITNWPSCTVVLCSSYTPDARTRRDLQALGIHVVTGRLRVAIAQLLRPAVPLAPLPQLTETEQEECRRARYKAHEIIEVTGQPEARRRNVLKVNGVEAKMGDASLAPFLLLLVGAFTREHGWVEEDDVLALDTGGSDIDHVMSEIRKTFSSAPIKCAPTALIEKFRGRARISIHPRFLSYDREQLLTHPDAVIRELAERLPTR